MAFGTFANLSPYTGSREPAKDTSLQDLLLSLQTSANIQNLPQAIKDAQIAKKFEQELNNLKVQALQQQVATGAYNLANPNQKFMQDLTLASIEKNLGLERVDPSISSLAQPGTISLTEDETAARIPVGPEFESDIPRAAPVGPTLEQIIASNGQPMGFVQNPVLRAKQEQAEADRDLNKIRAGAQARSEFYREGRKQYVSPDGKTSDWFLPNQQPEGWSAPVRTGGAGGMLTANARGKLIQQYADLTGIKDDKVLDDMNSGVLTTDKMYAVTGSLQGARDIGASEIKSFEAHSSLRSDFQKVSDAITNIESKFGPISGRWEEFIARFPVADQDPDVAETFALINSLAADQIHEKYGGALTNTEDKRAMKWALDTALPIQTLKARIKAANSQIDSHMGSLKKTLDARHIRAPELFKDEKKSGDALPFSSKAELEKANPPVGSKVTVNGQPGTWTGPSKSK